MKMPERARAEIVGAYDVEASRRAGRYIAEAETAARYIESASK